MHVNIIDAIVNKHFVEFQGNYKHPLFKQLRKEQKATWTHSILIKLFVHAIHYVQQLKTLVEQLVRWILSSTYWMRCRNFRKISTILHCLNVYGNNGKKFKLLNFRYHLVHKFIFFYRGRASFSKITKTSLFKNNFKRNISRPRNYLRSGIYSLNMLCGIGFAHYRRPYGDL